MPIEAIKTGMGLVTDGTLDNESDIKNFAKENELSKAEADKMIKHLRNLGDKK